MRVTSALRYNEGMTYKSLTPEMLARYRALNPLPMTGDGAWLNWPHSTKRPERKKAVRRAGAARYKTAKAFKPGGGKYS